MTTIIRPIGGGSTISELPAASFKNLRSRETSSRPRSCDVGRLKKARCPPTRNTNSSFPCGWTSPSCSTSSTASLQLRLWGSLPSRRFWYNDSMCLLISLSLLMESWRVVISIALRLLRLPGRRQSDRSLGSEQKKSECLLQVKPDSFIAMAEIPDGDVLPNVQFEITAACCQHESAADCWRPDDLVFHQPLDVLQHRVSVVTGFGERGVGVGAEQHGVRAVDANQAQLA